MDHFERNKICKTQTDTLDTTHQTEAEDILEAHKKRTPWYGISLAFHGLLLIIFTTIYIGSEIFEKSEHRFFKITPSLEQPNKFITSSDIDTRPIQPNDLPNSPELPPEFILNHHIESDNDSNETIKGISNIYSSYEHFNPAMVGTIGIGGGLPPGAYGEDDGGDKNRRALPGSKFFGIPVERDTVFILDLSTSMNKPCGEIVRAETAKEKSSHAVQATRKIDLAKQELSNALIKLPSEIKINIIFYYEKAIKWKEDMVAGTPENIKSALDFVAKQKADGLTDIWGALESAWKLLIGLDKPNIYLLSDGIPYPQFLCKKENKALEKPSCPDHITGDCVIEYFMGTQKILENIESLSLKNDIVINTIGLGDSADHEFLKKLATLTHGKYRGVGITK